MCHCPVLQHHTRCLCAVQAMPQWNICNHSMLWKHRQRMQKLKLHLLVWNMQRMPDWHLHQYSIQCLMHTMSSRNILQCDRKELVPGMHRVCLRKGHAVSMQRHDRHAVCATCTANHSNIQPDVARNCALHAHGPLCVRHRG
jgi:hypothetical protein